ncbi:MAG: HAD family phosphatase [Deltaproteobacteria bacterium]
MGIAFFDFDKTLIRKNSGGLWLVDELRRGAIGWFDFARAGVWLARYSVGFVDLEAGLRLAIRSLEGTREDDLRQRVEDFYAARVKHLYRPGGTAALQRHRENGDRIVLLTSASNYLSQIVQRELALDGFLANRFSVGADGVFTGEPDGELCYGPGKLWHANAYAEEHGVALADCAFYTDSMADLPVLEAVGVPVAVNPDPRLRRHALGRGWSVEDWG